MPLPATPTSAPRSSHPDRLRLAWRRTDRDRRDRRLPADPALDRFFIAAAAPDARSSPRLERWLLRHPRIGPAIRAWRADGRFPCRPNCSSGRDGQRLPGLWLTVRPEAPLAVVLAVVLMACAAYVLSRLGPNSPDQTDERAAVRITPRLPILTHV
ncbi:MAG: DUF454 family protein [Alphaproteobacteria bacterium]|nr:DUF454 family protein [Alphaproteobacteria bacterium]